jgi:hypothetical protein
MVETRKLAAILCSDVVGYSRLAGADAANPRDHPQIQLRRPASANPAPAVHYGDACIFFNSECKTLNMHVSPLFHRYSVIRTFEANAARSPTRARDLMMAARRLSRGPSPIPAKPRR